MRKRNMMRWETCQSADVDGFDVEVIKDKASTVMYYMHGWHAFLCMVGLQTSYGVGQGSPGDKAWP